MNIKFNIKGVILGVILLLFVVGGFVFIPSVFMDKSKPVDFVVVQRDSIPEKILDMMDDYVDEERALAVKLDGKVYVIATRGNDKNSGIEMDKISMIKNEEQKKQMKVNFTYKNKEDANPYVVVETNLTELPDLIEIETSLEK